MPKFTKPFRGAVRGDAFPTQFQVGDDCPPELVEAAKEADALEEKASAPKKDDKKGAA